MHGYRKSVSPLALRLALCLCGAVSGAMAQGQKASTRAPRSQRSLAERPAPQGMRYLPTGNSGRILVTHLTGASSARKLLQGLLVVSAEYFDGKPSVTAAYVNREDSNVQAAFTAKLGGVDERGVIAATTRGERGDGVLLFDRPQNLRASARRELGRANHSA